MNTSDEVEQKLATIVRALKPSAEFRPNAHAKQDLGLDSLDIMGLLMDVEIAFDIKIPEEDVASEQLLKLDHMAAYILRKVNN